MEALVSLGLELPTALQPESYIVVVMVVRWS